MQIFIVRHGQTDWNKDDIIAGQSDVKLTDRGRYQAELLGKRLANTQFDLILSSDLLRARETTEFIVEHQTQAPVFLNELRERHWGDEEGRPISDYLANLDNFAGDPWAYRPNGGESLEDLKERVSKWLAEFLQETRVERVLLSAHHSMNKMLIQVLLQKDWPEWFTVKQDNACLNILEYLASEARPILLNCTQHLDNKV